MKRITGNLIDLAEEAKFDIIVHGCNCFHKMGSGIAREIASRYPSVAAADNLTPRGDLSKLGTFSFAEVKSGAHGFTVVNAYTQYGWSGLLKDGRKDLFEYEKFSEFLRKLEIFSTQMGHKMGRKVRIGFPKIGCGYAKGDESRIVPMIEDFAVRSKDWAEVTLVTL